MRFTLRQIQAFVAIADLDNCEQALADAKDGRDGSPVAVVEAGRDAPGRRVDPESGRGAFRAGRSCGPEARWSWVMGGFPD